MLRNPIRALLLTSAAALSTAMLIPAHAVQAQTVAIPGGGSSLAAVDYAGPLVASSTSATAATPTSPSEMYTFNSANSSDLFQYFIASSGRGQNAFSNNDPTKFGYTDPNQPLPTFVAYAASDAFLTGATGTTVNGYTYTTVTGIPGLTADYSLRAGKDGALIQLPMLGIGITIPAASGNANIKTNGTLGLTDADLCGIFSGSITDYSNISTPVTGLSGTITVYYRGDSSGTSFLFTNHLKAVCVATDDMTGATANSNFTSAQLALMPTTSFANVLTGTGTFVAETGSAGIAQALAGTVTTSGGKIVGTAGNKQGIGYLSPDFTAISTTGKANATAAPSGSGFINTAKLFTAGIEATGASTFLTPTVANVGLGLANPAPGSTNPKSPTGTAAKNPLNWVPSIPTVLKGYPIVGYTDLELAQCYADPNVASAMSSFLLNHFQGTAAYKSTVTANGFTLPAAAFISPIEKVFLTAGSAQAIAPAGTAGTCAHVTGR